MKTHLALVTAIVCLLAQPVMSGTLGLARSLSHMIGYTIVGVGAVDKVTEAGMGVKIVRLQDGTKFKVGTLLLDPLPASDVVIFARAPSQEDINRYGASVPKESLILYKVLLGDEILDATSVAR